MPLCQLLRFRFRTKDLVAFDMPEYIQFIIGVLVGVAFISTGVKALRHRHKAVALKVFGEREWRNAHAALGVFMIFF